MRFCVISWIILGGLIFVLTGCELGDEPDGGIDGSWRDNPDHVVDSGMMIDLKFAIYEGLLEPYSSREADPLENEREEYVDDWDRAIDDDLNRSNEIFCIDSYQFDETPFGNTACHIHLSRSKLLEMFTNDLISPSFDGQVTPELFPYFFNPSNRGYALANFMVVKEIDACPRWNKLTNYKLQTQTFVKGCTIPDYGGSLLRSRAIGSSQNIIGHEIGHFFIKPELEGRPDAIIDNNGHVPCDKQLDLREGNHYVANEWTYMTGCVTNSKSRDTVVYFPVCDFFTTSTTSINMKKAGGECIKVQTEVERICTEPHHMPSYTAKTASCFESINH